MIVLGNDKLGPLVHGWSIPAKTTCPGASKTCLDFCYGLSGHYYLPTVIAALKRNLAASKAKEFVPWMILQLRDQFARVLRIHVTGDYYNNQYIWSWIEIVQNSPQVSFYTYTRSWSVPDYYDNIVKLGRLRNVRMWYSFDRDMATPPRDRGVKHGYMSIHDDDQPPAKTDLVFRHRTDTIMTRDRHHSLVCPFENGLPVVTDCSHCQRCFGKKGESCIKTARTTPERP